MYKFLANSLPKWPNSSPKWPNSLPWQEKSQNFPCPGWHSRDKIGFFTRGILAPPAPARQTQKNEAPTKKTPWPSRYLLLQITNKMILRFLLYLIIQKGFNDRLRYFMLLELNNLYIEIISVSLHTRFHLRRGNCPNCDLLYLLAHTGFALAPFYFKNFLSRGLVW